MGKRGFTKPRANTFLLGTGLSHESGLKGGVLGGFKRNLIERKLVFLLRGKESEQRKRKMKLLSSFQPPIFWFEMTAVGYCFERLLA